MVIVTRKSGECVILASGVKRPQMLLSILYSTEQTPRLKFLAFKVGFNNTDFAGFSEGQPT